MAGEIVAAGSQAGLHVRSLGSGQVIARVVGVVFFPTSKNVGAIPFPARRYNYCGIIPPLSVRGQEHPPMG